MAPNNIPNNVPASAPPPGVVTDYTGSWKSHVPLICINAIFITLAIASVALQCYSRFCIQKRFVELEDGKYLSSEVVATD